MSYDADQDMFTATVTVKNTGSVSGKSVVQLYVQTPYGDYEKQNAVEKSAVQVIGYGKTDELKPGQSEQVTVTMDRYMMASYDYTNAKGYILSAGDYYLALGDNAHDALNNILAAKGASGMVDQDGNAVRATPPRPTVGAMIRWIPRATAALSPARKSPTSLMTVTQTTGRRVLLPT